MKMGREVRSSQTNITADILAFLEGLLFEEKGSGKPLTSIPIISNGSNEALPFRRF